VVRQRSAKPLFVGSIPTRASIEITIPSHRIIVLASAQATRAIPPFPAVQARFLDLRRAIARQRFRLS
jgi:hypothetical protein